MTQSKSHGWSCGNHRIGIGFDEIHGPGPAWLLLPTSSTISSRREWQLFREALLNRHEQGKGARTSRLISVDWPGFGESERPRLPYDAALLARVLADFRGDCCPADCGLIAAGPAGRARPTP